MKQGEARGGQIFALSLQRCRGPNTFRSADSLVGQSERNEAFLCRLSVEERRVG